MTPRIISRAEGGIVPQGHTSARVARPAQWLLAHHTGDTGWPKPGWSDAQHMAALQSASINMGKTWEYNYIITHPNGWIWEMGGEFQASHCLNANGFSYGVQLNQASSFGRLPHEHPVAVSFRWLRQHLVETGQLTPGHLLVPHYGLRATACSSTDMAQSPGARRPNSPTGEGSLGNVWPELSDPYVATPPPPSGGIIVTPEDKAYLDAKFAEVANQVWNGINLLDTPYAPSVWMVGTHNNAQSANIQATEANGKLNVEVITQIVTDAINEAAANGDIAVPLDAAAVNSIATATVAKLKASISV